MKKILTLIALFLLIIMIIIGGLFMIYSTPTVTFDANDLRGEVTNNASGYLYGIAEYGVPSQNMVDSVGVSIVSVRPPHGLQHPIGDIAHIAPMLDNVDYIVVYTQDMYDTWYYDESEIRRMRKEGTYDWENYLVESYFPKLEAAVNSIKDSEYRDRVVYCIYNEADNGVWFGEWNESEQRSEFNGVGRENFYKAWKMTYEYVKSIDPNAIIGGPGNYDYNHDKIKSFLAYCEKNDCIPEVMIYHELSRSSVDNWQENVDDYRQIEKDLGIEELPIFVTEYACMDECGEPGTMARYISAIEYSKVYGCMAYWRLANNLNDVSADDNSPNSNWWLYRWYTLMQGQLMGYDYKDSMRSYIEKNKQDNIELRFIKNSAMAAIDQSQDKVEIIMGGTDFKSNIKLKNLSKNFNGRVLVSIEGVYYKGLSGIVNEPTLIKEYNAVIKDGRLTIKMDKQDSSSAYRIVVQKSDKIVDFKNDNLPERYEFERGRLLGDAYTYNSAYATTGDIKGMVGGMEKNGDGVELPFNVNEDGYYQLDIIYGNSNDGPTPSHRKNSITKMTINGIEKMLSLPNTIRSEYTNCHTEVIYLNKGSHTIKFEYVSGTIALDSMLVSTHKENEYIYIQPNYNNSDKNASYLAIAPYDGWYDINVTGSSSFSIDNIPINNISNNQALVYLARGINRIDFSGKGKCVIKKSSDRGQEYVVHAQELDLSDGATLKNSENGTKYISDITSEGGAASYVLTAEQAGVYRITLLYSNNAEGGIHAYNIDLKELFITVSINGITHNVYCRNTYSDHTFKTVTFAATLDKGDNIIILSNDGSNKFNNQDNLAPNIASLVVAFMG